MGNTTSIPKEVPTETQPESAVTANDQILTSTDVNPEIASMLNEEVTTATLEQTTMAANDNDSARSFIQGVHECRNECIEIFTGQLGEDRAQAIHRADIYGRCNNGVSLWEAALIDDRVTVAELLAQRARSAQADGEEGSDDGSEESSDDSTTMTDSSEGLKRKRTRIASDKERKAKRTRIADPHTPMDGAVLPRDPGSDDDDDDDGNGGNGGNGAADFTGMGGPGIQV